jgi:hypothetical protein
VNRGVNGGAGGPGAGAGIRRCASMGAGVAGVAGAMSGARAALASIAIGGHAEGTPTDVARPAYGAAALLVFAAVAAWAAGRRCGAVLLGTAAGIPLLGLALPRSWILPFGAVPMVALVAVGAAILLTGAARPSSNLPVVSASLAGICCASTGESFGLLAGVAVVPLATIGALVVGRRAPAQPPVTSTSRPPDS